MPLTLRTFTITRSGTSNFLVTGDHHCGPKSELVEIRQLPSGQLAKVGTPGLPKAIPVRWDVAVECEPSLDSRGFLFDQAMLGVFMDRVASETTSLSCELLARHAAERLIARLEKLPQCKIKRLRLVFSPAPHAASITVVYD